MCITWSGSTESEAFPPRDPILAIPKLSRSLSRSSSLGQENTVDLTNQAQREWQLTIRLPSGDQDGEDAPLARLVSSESAKLRYLTRCRPRSNPSVSPTPVSVIFGSVSTTSKSP
jgi:hypothetical protein